jgi:hypothetical protein
MEENSMEVLIKKLTTGDIMVFDKKTRELFLISPQHAAVWEAGADQSVNFARHLAESGQASHFTRHDLEVLQSALARVTVLG